MPEPQNHSTVPFAAMAAVVIVLILCIEAWTQGWNPFDRSEAHARAAIDVAVSACEFGNAFVFREKLFDAKTAIDKVPALHSAEIEATLSNRLKLAGCPSY